jgi:hypothetical protein
MTEAWQSGAKLPDLAATRSQPEQRETDHRTSRTTAAFTMPAETAEQTARPTPTSIDRDRLF